MKINYYGIDLVYEDGKLQFISSSPDPYEWIIADELTKVGDTVIVAGSGSGSITALLIGKGCKVISFEPNFKLRKQSQDGIRVDFGYIDVHHEALWTETGTAVMNDNGFHSKLVMDGSGNHSGYTVQTVDTQDVLDVTEANVLVLDVEGAEYAILPHIDTSSLDALIVEAHGDIEPIVNSVDMELVNQMTYTTSTVLGFKRKDLQ